MTTKGNGTKGDGSAKGGSAKGNPSAEGADVPTAGPAGMADGRGVAVAGAVVAVIGIATGLFMWVAGLAFGLAALVLGIVAARRGAGRAAVVTIVLAVLALASGTASLVVVFNAMS